MRSVTHRRRPFRSSIPTRGPVVWTAALFLLAAAGPLTAQDVPDERARLTAELEAARAGGDDGLALRLAHRLEEGDFRVGDRIVLRVVELTDFPDEVVVEPGPSIRLPLVGTIPLGGLLHSELEGKLRTELQRFVLEPRVTVDVLVQVGVQGSVRNPGFYSIAGSLGLSDLIMMAGGLDSQAAVDAIRVTRGGVTVLEGEEAVEALTLGSTLTQLDVRPGDQVVVPQKGSRNWVQGALALSGLAISIATLLLR